MHGIDWNDYETRIFSRKDYLTIAAGTNFCDGNGNLYSYDVPVVVHVSSFWHFPSQDTIFAKSELEEMPQGTRVDKETAFQHYCKGGMLKVYGNGRTIYPVLERRVGNILSR